MPFSTLPWRGESLKATLATGLGDRGGTGVPGASDSELQLAPPTWQYHHIHSTIFSFHSRRIYY